MLYDKVMLDVQLTYLLMFWFLTSKYKSLGDFNLLVIIPHHQILSIKWCIWNITSEWTTLTISLHELASKFAHTWAWFFFNFHGASIYTNYINGHHFFLAFPWNLKLISGRYWLKFISAYKKVTKNVTNGALIFEHHQKFILLFLFLLTAAIIKNQTFWVKFILSS